MVAYILELPRTRVVPCRMTPAAHISSRTAGCVFQAILGMLACAGTAQRAAARRPPSAYGHSIVGKENVGDAANVAVPPEGADAEEEEEEEDAGPPPDR